MTIRIHIYIYTYINVYMHITWDSQGYVLFRGLALRELGRGLCRFVLAFGILNNLWVVYIRLQLVFGDQWHLQVGSSCQSENIDP